MVRSQTGSFTPIRSFGHNLCFRCSIEQCEPISDIYVLRAFQWYKEHHKPLNFDPWNCFLTFLESTGTLLQPHLELNVRMKLTLPKMGTWSPLGLPKTQSSIVGVKTPRIGMLFIPLERSWIVDVQNGLAWAIWTYVAQVMGKRRARSQTASLTPDH